MVKLIINENTSHIDVSELTELVKSLQNDNKVLLDIVNNLFNTINGLNNDINSLTNEFLIFKDKMNNDLDIVLDELKSNDTKKAKELISTAIKNIEKTTKTNPPKKEDITKKTTQTLQKLTNSSKENKNRKKKRRVNDEDVFEPGKNLRTEWKNLVLSKNGNIINKGPKQYTLPVTLNELLYIKELDNPHMLRGVAKKLMRIYDITPGTFGKLIYNLRETDNFKTVLKDYYDKLSKARFRIKDNIVMVNNTNTNISVDLASEWIQILANSSKKQEKILEIQKQYSEFNKDMIRIICDSYNNPKLNTLLSFNNKKEGFVENNPSKRRNLIQNGGVI